MDMLWSYRKVKINMREKFTTTLTKEIKKKLNILADNNNLDKNEYLEQIINEKWEIFIGGIKNEKDY